MLSLIVAPFIVEVLKIEYELRHPEPPRITPLKPEPEPTKRDKEDRSREVLPDLERVPEAKQFDDPEGRHSDLGQEAAQ